MNKDEGQRLNNPIHLYYRVNADLVAPSDGEPPSSIDTRLWRPSLFQPFPPGHRELKFLVWFLFDVIGVFRPGGYAVFQILDGEAVVHRSCIFPRFFRFPFMGIDDLQVGDTWTSTKARGRGLATRALREICRLHRGKNLDVWYLVDEGNPASVKVAEKAGFSIVGFGRKRPRLGLNLLGYYSLDRTHRAAGPDLDPAD